MLSKRSRVIEAEAAQSPNTRTSSIRQDRIRMRLFAHLVVLFSAVCLRNVHSFCVRNSAITRVHRSTALAATQRKAPGGSRASSTPESPQFTENLPEVDWNGAQSQLGQELQEVADCLRIAIKPFLKLDKKVTTDDILDVCAELDVVEPNAELVVSRVWRLRERCLAFQRYELLVKLMRADYSAYIATASFLSPSRIPRYQLPNVQDVPMNEDAATFPAMSVGEDGITLVADCELENMTYKESVLDKFLLKQFRKLVEKHSGVHSDKEGIEGLLEQGRTFMLSKRGQIPEVQHKMVKSTLGGLMTPVLPPFYRIFMSGIFPKLGTSLDEKQLGPWFYAPYLTSIVTPTFFAFLVGPSIPNRRKDGQLGGLVVEKCRFLQESGCKGLCLHQCKLPAQQFFQEELGLPLTVSPNFVTQECQWSFGEKPLPPEEDPSFPMGCLVGCESRKAMAGTNLEICSR